ncbi:signal transduction histidine kinase [Antricoccus suffuscus]|uniref:histidine kinase n=1 Tax=Antricoccus suffuscus TaxID=1629062 RepID=A0A2T1A2M6_9ACTN|nr:histidine kinase [Antricoccus suffuscus]PRZ42794.1 signal transduction histidine kinase [Antricoccus suffuscus]
MTDDADRATGATIPLRTDPADTTRRLLQSKNPRVDRIRETLLLAAAVVLDVFLFSDVVAPDPRAGGPQTAWGIVLACGVLMFGVLLLRVRARIPVFLVVCALSVAITLSTTYRPVVPVCIVLAGVIAFLPLRAGVFAAVVAIVPAMSWVYSEARTHDFDWGAGVYVGILIGYLAILLVGAGIGWWRKTADRNYELRRAEAARAAVMSVRSEVARELHDIVAHAVTLMVLQASGARAVMTHDQQRALDALDVVEKTGTQAMAELRRLLSVLRTSDVDEHPIHELVLPPGLDEMPALLESIRATGVEVILHAEGSPRPLARSVDAAAYRIVSESLTNVTKHSGAGATVNVHFKWTAAQLDIKIWDNGLGRGADERLSTGNGLLGLTERIVLAGGAFEAKPRDAGGYEVHATLPIPSTTPAVAVTGGATL